VPRRSRCSRTSEAPATNAPFDVELVEPVGERAIERLEIDPARRSAGLAGGVEPQQRADEPVGTLTRAEREQRSAGTVLARRQQEQRFEVGLLRLALLRVGGQLAVEQPNEAQRPRAADVEDAEPQLAVGDYVESLLNADESAGSAQECKPARMRCG